MHQLVLWRLEHATAECVTRPDRLADGLRLHAQHAPLLTTLIQVGAHQRAFVATRGCRGCAEDRCEAGCYGELLRRLIAATVPGSSLAASSGLAARPYRRAVLAWPAARARYLPASALAGWEEARLTLHWSAAARGGVAVAGVLAVSADGPDPAQVLASFGWLAPQVPAPLIGRVAAPPVPRPIPVRRPWRGAPALLFASAVSTDAAESAASAVSADAAESAASAEAAARDAVDGREPRAADALSYCYGPVVYRLSPRLAGAIAGALRRRRTEPAAHAAGGGRPPEEARPARDTAALPATLYAGAQGEAGEAGGGEPEGHSAAPERDGSPWPHGPGALHPQALRELVERMVASPVLTAGQQASQIGLTRRRLEQLPGVTPDLARALLVWFDAAHVIADPYHPDRPWVSPRPLLDLDPQAIAARLRATPLPSAEAIAAAFGT